MVLLPYVGFRKSDHVAFLVELTGVGVSDHVALLFELTGVGVSDHVALLVEQIGIGIYGHVAVLSGSYGVEISDLEALPVEPVETCISDHASFWLGKLSRIEDSSAELADSEHLVAW
ncbi:hypothetical protein BHE74_00003344 [Ensete ventricosum]|nr:hypothetical protein BHE74_00003344 [Ensete ventricosum]